MKKTKADPGLHLVSAEEALLIATEKALTRTEPSSRQDTDTLIAHGIRRYQQLQQELDRALFAEHQDVDKISVLLPELRLVRDRLASYGIHMRP